MVLDDGLSSILYATYYGGSQSNEHVDGGTSRFDKGIIYQSVCAGCGGNSDFPIEPNPGAVSTTNNSSQTVIMEYLNLILTFQLLLLIILQTSLDVVNSGLFKFDKIIIDIS